MQRSKNAGQVIMEDDDHMAVENISGNSGLISNLDMRAFGSMITMII